MTIFHKINRFLQWDYTERRLFLVACVLIPAVSLRLKILGIKRTMSLLGHSSDPESDPHMGESIALALSLRIAELVKKAVFYSPFKGKCLSQSMLLWYLLRRQGVDSEICIGVQKGLNQYGQVSVDLSAHAWVEFRGHVLNDQADVRQRFSAFEYIPGLSEK